MQNPAQLTVEAILKKIENTNPVNPRAPALIDRDTISHEFSGLLAAALASQFKGFKFVDNYIGAVEVDPAHGAGGGALFDVRIKVFIVVKPQRAASTVIFFETVIESRAPSLKLDARDKARVRALLEEARIGVGATLRTAHLKRLRPLH